MSNDHGPRRAASEEMADSLGLGSSEHRHARGTRRALLVLLALVAALVLMVGAVAAYYLGTVNSALDKMHRDANLMPSSASSASSPTSTADHEPLTFVIMGSDSRTASASQGRSDVLMVAYLTGDRKHLYLISFPRDMWVDIPGHGTAKINAAYAYGGPALTVSTLESLTGVKMDHVVVMDFQGFVDLTNSLGGVTVDNEHAGSWMGYTFAQGPITVQGEQALAFVRERYDLPNGDLDRAKRQREVITAIMSKVASKDTLTDPQKFASVTGQLGGYMTVDSSLTSGELWKIATGMRFTGSDGVRQLQAPLAGFGTSADGQSYDIVDRAGLAELSKAMASDQLDAYWQNHRA
ncbi:cell envelope-related function transcriptional attenuator common domain-containing protein [Propionibacterium cyclohexanicum]|uniref:Cell envelope-related function transcriptional attenuator common domain-containing protein n=1 Tax=Propionibacterium cyclohexanicum TaxID=64702 RepID=A0A1H9TCG8_9ACTN|nr:cell envelope-related function transcriptional attenuator common domain-containing protein [Propionibacterium cyclohexanicum]